MTTHPSPFHRQRQSNKTLDPNSDTARFLYTILDQLELKNINWNKVAHNLNITNGHAARMRWSRFKAQLEGMDNSYARRNNKKSVAPKKRRVSKIDRQRSFTQAQIYDEMAATRLKTHTDTDMKMEDKMGSGRGYGGEEKYDTVGVEAPRRMSTINGVNIHHPTVTLINKTAPNPPFFPTRPDAASNIPGNSQYRPSNYAPHLPNDHTHRMPGSQTTHQWQQRVPSSAYTYGAQRPSMAQPLYSAVPNAYRNPYGNHYPQMYGHNQQVAPNRFYPQPRFTPTPLYRGPNGMPSLVSTVPSAQSRRSLADQSPNVNRPNITSTNLPSPIETQAPTQGYNLTLPTTGASNRTPAHVRALEMASQASYPWPHSEASLPQFIYNAIEPDTNAPAPIRPIDTTNSTVNYGHQGRDAIGVSSTNPGSQQAEHSQDKNITIITGQSTGTQVPTSMINETRNDVKAAMNQVIIKTQPADEESAISHIKIEADADVHGTIVI